MEEVCPQGVFMWPGWCRLRAVLAVCGVAWRQHIVHHHLRPRPLACRRRQAVCGMRYAACNVDKAVVPRSPMRFLLSGELLFG